MSEKRRAFLDLLNVGKVMIHLDARVPGVEVPDHLQSDPQLRLDFSYSFNLPLFHVEDDAIKATLSFGGNPFTCVIPWRAVYGMNSHVTDAVKFWPESVPAEVMQKAAAMAAAEEVEVAEDGEPAVGGAVRRAGHLRVIK